MERREAKTKKRNHTPDHDVVVLVGRRQELVEVRSHQLLTRLSAGLMIYTAEHEYIKVDSGHI